MYIQRIYLTSSVLPSLMGSDGRTSRVLLADVSTNPVDGYIWIALSYMYSTHHEQCAVPD